MNRGKAGPRIKGWGDCYICTQNNDENFNCKGYSPLKIYKFEVIGNDDSIQREAY